MSQSPSINKHVLNNSNERKIIENENNYSSGHMVRFVRGRKLTVHCGFFQRKGVYGKASIDLCVCVFCNWISSYKAFDWIDGLESSNCQTLIDMLQLA